MLDAGHLWKDSYDRGLKGTWEAIARISNTSKDYLTYQATAQWQFRHPTPLQLSVRQLHSTCVLILGHMSLSPAALHLAAS